MLRGNLGDLFEQFIGLEIWRYGHLTSQKIKLRYWRDANGPEIDYVLEREQQYIPIEVKWSETPGSQDARHIYKFLDEYSEANEGYIICRTPRRFKINKMITAIPWQDVSQLFTDK